MDQSANLQNNQKVNNKRLRRSDTCFNLDNQKKSANPSHPSSIKTNDKDFINKRRSSLLDFSANLDSQKKFANPSPISTIKSNDKDLNSKRRLSLSDLCTNFENQTKFEDPSLKTEGSKLKMKLLHFEKELNSIEEIDSGSEYLKESTIKSTINDQEDHSVSRSRCNSRMSSLRTAVVYKKAVTDLDNENSNSPASRGINKNFSSTDSLDHENEEIKKSIRKHQSHKAFHFNTKYNKLMDKEEILKQSFKKSSFKSRLMQKHSSLAVKSRNFNHNEFKD